MRRHVFLATFLLAFGLPTFAHAEDAAMAEAQARFSEGLELADKYKYEEARLKFLQAASVLKAPSVLFNLARTEQATGHDVEAIEHYRQFIVGSANDTRINDAMREKAKQNITDLLRKVGQIDVDAPIGSKLSLDGKPLDETPKEPLPVTPGRHEVSATFEGRVKSVTVDAPLGTVVPVKLVFDNTPTTDPPHTEGSKTSWPTARIVTVSALAAGAVAGGIMAVVFQGKAQGNVDDARDLLHGASCVGVTSAACSTARSLKDDRDSNLTIATVSAIAGGVFAAGAIATVFFWPKSSKEKDSARLVPSVAPGYGGASFVGRF
ncbi:hypothetical protein AKJ09_06006 [Labilithrix luteola]|uniref:PEGA domain-containing protein n=1 Tax=Labilithrix luteola TaxID=1391654 RepID=A0A0K1Q0T0_9BACT|nr:hypothetical protein [Labilithrix luteola]AKU99342.1 hypothetical protein AKJ09_06006 [Labilithrix luteola]